MPAALARASMVLDAPDLLAPAIADTAVFTPHLLTVGGPDNGWSPTPVDRTQIAHGVDSRLQSLLAVATATDSAGLRQLAGLTAGWYFGANAAGAPMYDPATGRTFDGVSADGVINRNSGAESTIHGLMSMLELDASPDAADLAVSARMIVHRDTTTVVEAEAGQLSDGARVERPESAWTGESQWSGGAFVDSSDGAQLRWEVPASSQARLVQPVVNLVPDPDADDTRWESAGGPLGAIDHDAALLHSVAEDVRVSSVQLSEAGGPAVVWSYDSNGQVVERRPTGGPRCRSRCSPGVSVSCVRPRS